MAPNFEAVVSVLLQICVKFAGVCHIRVFFIEEVPLLGEMTDKLVLTFVWGQN